jgi:hypothetical protein
MKTGGSEANAIRMLEMVSEPPFLEIMMSYVVMAEVKGFENRKILEALSKKNQLGMGYSLIDGIADVSWEFKRKNSALLLVKKLKKLKKRIHVNMYGAELVK